MLQACLMKPQECYNYTALKIHSLPGQEQLAKLNNKSQINQTSCSQKDCAEELLTSLHFFFFLLMVWKGFNPAEQSDLPNNLKITSVIQRNYTSRVF